MNTGLTCEFASSSSETDSSEVQWYGLQTLFEQASSDVLILLDCCAAASSAAGTGRGVTEVIAACGFESWAPGVGDHSFTRSLIDELKYLSTGPSFSAALLHCKVLSRIKSSFNPRFAPGEHHEPRRTPVHIVLGDEARRRSIELTPMVFQSSVTKDNGLGVGSSTQVSTLSSEPSDDVHMQSPKSSQSSVDQNRQDIEPNYPRVIMSIALERDQELHPNEWTDWISSIPALANAVTIEGLYHSHSTLLLLSLPVAVWDMLPDNQAVTFIGFIRSTNMMLTLKKPTSAISSDVVENQEMADVNAAAAGPKGRMTLQAAAGGGHLVMVERLLRENGDVNAAGYEGSMALKAAAEGGHLAVVERLL